MNHGSNRKSAFEEQAGHGSPDRPELTGGAGNEYRSAIYHRLISPFSEAECQRHKDVCRGIHAQSVSGTAFETFSLEPCSLSGIREESRRLSITPVTEKSCLGRQDVNLDVALQFGNWRSWLRQFQDSSARK